MTAPRSSEALDSATAVWAELRQHLEGRFQHFCSELRHYPTPIARCDDQLPKLIEQRDRARAELGRMRAIDAASAGSRAPPVEAIERFLDGATPADDEIELDFRSRLKAAIRGSRG